jgi:predicted ATP-grasp superfamily ATP-dependent carboligase
MLTGVSSDLLLFCVEKDMKVTSLMVETHYTPDPLGSATLLRILSELLDLKIDTKKLVEKGQEVERMFHEINEQMKKGADDTKQMCESYSPMYC